MKQMYFFTVFLIILTSFDAEASTNGQSLQKSFQKLATNSDSRVGICALGDKATELVCVNGDQRFSLQSVMKLVVAAAVMDSVDRKQIKLDEVVVIRPENASPGPQEFADLVRKNGSLKTNIHELIERAVVDSDSTSVDFLVERLGGIVRVQEFLQNKRLEGISIDRDERHLQAESMGLTWRAEYADYKKFEAAVNGLSIEKRDTAWKAYLKDSRDTATPEGMVRFLKALASGKLLSENSTQKLLAIMAKTVTGRDRLMAGVPKGWSLGHKTGTSPSWGGMTAATNDVGILTAPDGRRVAVAVFVADSKKTREEQAAIIASAAKHVTEAHGANH